MLLGERGLHDDDVLVVERGRGEDRAGPAGLLEGLSLGVGGGRRRRQRLFRGGRDKLAGGLSLGGGGGRRRRQRLARDGRDDLAGVLGVDLDLVRLERGVDDLRTADIALQGDREAFGLQGLLVERTEEVLFGEVLVAERDRRFALAWLAGGQFGTAAAAGRGRRGTG